METVSNKNTAALINLSTFAQYCIPLGNFIFPIILWSANKDKSEYINLQGKQTINFQLSLLVYSLVLGLIALPILLVTFFQKINFTAVANGNDFVLENFNFESSSTAVVVALTVIVVFLFMKMAEFFLIIYAAVKTSNGENFKYPFTIPFLK